MSEKEEELSRGDEVEQHVNERRRRAIAARANYLAQDKMGIQQDHVRAGAGGLEGSQASGEAFEGQP